MIHRGFCPIIRELTSTVQVDESYYTIDHPSYKYLSIKIKELSCGATWHNFIFSSILFY